MEYTPSACIQPDISPWHQPVQLIHLIGAVPADMSDGAILVNNW